MKKESKKEIMSARVLNPVMLTEFYKMSSPAMMRNNLSSNRNLNTIKKDLFGSPNPNETKRLFQDELGKHQDIASRKWGFDFRTGFPIVNNGKFVWEPVQYTDFIPQMYTLSHAAHIRDIPDILETTSANDLLDQRAAKENELSSSPLSPPLSPLSPLSSLSPTNVDPIVVTNSGDSTEDDDETLQQPDKIIFKIPTKQNNMLLVAAKETYCSLRSKRRQPKITEYMKERKRLVTTVTPKKMVSPNKRMRMTTTTTATTTTTTTKSTKINNNNNSNSSYKKSNNNRTHKCNLFSSSTSIKSSSLSSSPPSSSSSSTSSTLSTSSTSPTSSTSSSTLDENKF